jgi:hypothetical protein
MEGNTMGTRYNAMRFMRDNPVTTKAASAQENEVNRSRCEDLREKLGKLEAREINAVKGPNESVLTFYALNGSLVMVQWYPRNGGYEVYAPIFSGNEVKGVYDALNELASGRNASR